MPQQVDTSGAITNAAPGADDSTGDLPTITVQSTFDWLFWALLGLTVWVIATDRPGRSHK